MGFFVGLGTFIITAMIGYSIFKEGGGISLKRKRKKKWRIFEDENNNPWWWDDDSNLWGMINETFNLY